MSKPFASGFGFSNVKALGIVIVLIFIGISWVLTPYTAINCYEGSCSLTRGEEHLESFEMSEIEDCNVKVRTERRRSGSGNRSRYRDVSVYYPIITLEDGRKIQHRAINYSSSSRAEDFCYSLRSNSNFHYKTK